MNPRDLNIGKHIRRAFADGNRMIIISCVDRGFQVSIKRPDGKSFGVTIDEDPIEALYLGCVPFRFRTRVRDDDLFGPLPDQK